MASAFLTAAQAASPSALDEWVSGERDSPACVDLLELAAAVSAASLRALMQELPTVGGASWLQGADVKRFLGLIVALLASEDAEVTCAAATAFLAALRCLGNGTPGLFHPLALHELCKSLPAVLCSGDAVPAPRKKGRRKQQQDSDDDEEMEDVGGAPPPAKAADGLAKELCLFLEAVPLVCYPETLSQLVAALVEAAARGAGSRVYLPLTCCLGSEHGELASTARTVLRSLKPSLTLTRETSPNQSATEAQAACVDFLIRLCTHNADDARAHDEPRTKALQHVVQTLLQHAAVGAPDKAEARALVCNAVCAVLAVLPTEEAVRYAGFLLRYSRTSKVGARVLSVEMASTALLAAAASSSSRRTSLTADGVPQILWKLLVQRISDKAPGVRTKSLGCVAVLLVKLHAEPGHRLLLQVQMPVPVPVPAAAAAAVSPMMPPPPGAMMPPAVLDASSGGGPVGSPLAESRSSSSGAQVEAASSLPTIGALLQQRCVDERPAVRRAALQAIEAWARASGMQVSGSQLKLISRGCSDVSPAIRKQAARSLWAMLQLEPQSAELQAAWTSAILPLASDTEQTVCDACLDTVLEGVLKPLARSKKPRDLAGWPLLLQLPESAMPYLCRAVRLLARQKRLPGGLAPKLQALLAEPPQPDGAAAAGGRPVVWSLLAEMAKLPLADLTQQKLDHAAVLRCWELASGGEAAGQPEDAASALQLLAGLSGRSLLATELGLTLRGQLVERLQRFDASPQLAVLLVQACSSLASPAAREPWAAALLKQCEARLAAGGAALADDQRELRVCAIAVGEVALVAPRAVTPSLVASLQELAHGGGGGGGAAPASRAAAFVALGKVCMGSVEVAQRLLPVFMTALTSHEDAAVRSNALVILFDLAKRHTALLERHFSTMALALYDAAASVRHSALLLFSQLLLEDYVKWRPTLFRAFCVALADVEPAVRASAQVCLFELLLPRSPLLAFNSFAGLLFQINGCTQHAQHSATLATAESAALEGLRGEGLSAQRRRLLIFRPLLGCMSGEQKLQTMAKLSQDVRHTPTPLTSLARTPPSLPFRGHAHA